MKVYDKEIYQKQESIKYTVIIIVVFLLGFVAGYLASSFSNFEPKSNNNTIKIEKINWFYCKYTKEGGMRYAR